MKKRHCLGAAVGLVILVSRGWTAVLPAGTPLEVRLASGAGSRRSHPGDPIRAFVIGAPTKEDGQLLPRGSTVLGTVVHAKSIGFGLKCSVATLRMRFDSLQLPDGQIFPLKTRLREIETAKERVDQSGLIQGVDPRANVSTGTSILLTSIMSAPEVAISLMAVKTLIARSPDSEIYLPPGSEMVLEVMADAKVPDVIMPGDGMEPLDREDVTDAQHLLTSIPQLQAFKGKKQPSDLINVMLLGNRGQIDRAFSAAGWNGEQPHSALTLYRMYHCIVQRTGYAMAPMAKLTFNGEMSQLTYQKSLNTFAKRHHIRIWKQKESGAWLAAATEDVSFAFRRFHVTHEIDPEIDNERAKVVNDLWNTGCVEAGSLLPGEQFQRAHQQGGMPATDDGIAILRLNDCSSHQIATPQLSASSPGGLARLSKSALRAATVDVVRSNALFSMVGFTRAFVQRTKLKGAGEPTQLSFADNKTRDSHVVRPYKWQRRTAMRTEGDMPELFGAGQLSPVVARRAIVANQ